MALNLANLEEAFNDSQAHTDQTYQNTGLQAERGYIRRDTLDNKKGSNLQIKNYRTTKYTKNPKYLFKSDQIYDLEGITNGYGPGKNIMVDDKLTRGNMEPKPNDRLAEKVTLIRHVDFLPIRHKQIYHDKFLVSTTLSTQPQTSFCPQWDRTGLNCRHYNRKTDNYFKNKYQRN